jgi:hypothetical protein
MARMFRLCSSPYRTHHNETIHGFRAVLRMTFLSFRCGVTVVEGSMKATHSREFSIGSLNRRHRSLSTLNARVHLIFPSLLDRPFNYHTIGNGSYRIPSVWLWIMWPFNRYPPIPLASKYATRLIDSNFLTVCHGLLQSLLCTVICIGVHSMSYPLRILFPSLAL